MIHLRSLSRTAIALVVAFMPLTAVAQGYPAKAIGYVVPFPPAGATDILAFYPIGESMIELAQLPAEHA